MILALLLIAATVYITYDKLQDIKQRDVLVGYQQGYNRAFIDTLSSIWQQTENCSIATVNIGNLSKRVFDVSCLQQK